MATRRFMINPGESAYNVTEAVGSATASKSIEVTVDLANVKSGGTQAITRDEFLEGLEEIKDYVLRGLWPPA